MMTKETILRQTIQLLKQVDINNVTDIQFGTFDYKDGRIHTSIEIISTEEKSDEK